MSDAAADQTQPRAEREMVDDHVVGAQPPDNLLDLVGDRHRVPQQVVAAGPGLEQQGLQHAATGRGEEPAQRVVLAAGLLVRADDAGVGAAAQLEVHALEPERPDYVGRGGSGRDHHPLSRAAPGGSQGREWKEVGRVVGADDQQRHQALTSGTSDRSGAASSA